jgi:hypothetical protein
MPTSPACPSFASQTSTKPAEHDQLHGRPVRLGRQVRDRGVGGTLGAATVDEQARQCALGHVLVGEGRERAPDMPAGIAVLQSPGEDDVEGHARHDAELARPGDRAGQPPR